MGSTVLLVTEHVLSSADVDAVIEASGGSPDGLTVVVAVPQHATARSTQSVIDGLGMDIAASRGEEAIDLPNQAPDPATAALQDAERVLSEVVAAFASAGADASGEVTPKHPLETIGDIVAAKDIDEVVVMVEHRGLGGMLRTDLASRIQRHFDLPAVRLHAHE